MAEITPGRVAAFAVFVVCLKMVSSEQQTGATDNETFPRQPHRRELKRKLIVTTILQEPYMMMKERSAFLAGNDRYEGYLADILQRLASSVGFQYETRLARDGKYGEMGANGIWDGMVGEVQSGEADIAAGPLIATDTLRQYVDFTEPFLSLRWSALIRRPDVPLPRGFGRPSSTSRPTATTRLSTAAQLLRSDLLYGVVENSEAQHRLSTSADPVARSLWTRLIAAASSRTQSNGGRGGGARGASPPDPLVRSVQEGVDRARFERYAFILDSPMAEFIASREPCDLYTVEPFLDVAAYAFAVRRRPVEEATRSLRAAIDREMRRMKQSGEMQSMYLRWWRDECGLVAAENGRTSRGGGGGGGEGVQRPAVAAGGNELARRHTSSGGAKGAGGFVCSVCLSVFCATLLLMLSGPSS